MKFLFISILSFFLVLLPSCEQTKEEKTASKELLEKENQAALNEPQYIGEINGAGKLYCFWVRPYVGGWSHAIYVLDNANAITVQQPQQLGKTLLQKSVIILNGKEYIEK